MKMGRLLHQPCPCQTGQPLIDCCYPLIYKRQRPLAAEQLMRSRYTAYTLGEIKYIAQTMRGPAKADFTTTQAKTWNKTITWQGLTVIRTHAGGPDDTTGWVEFTAQYLQNQQQKTLQEISLFEKIQQRWYYVDRCDHWPK